jgi:DNA-binding FadR family transcriptional regulator
MTATPITIKRSTLSERVGAELIQLIIDGVYPPGTTLPTEPHLEQQFGVSRVTIRDAIKLLVSRRLIAVKHGSGMSVLPESRWHYLDSMVLFAHVTSPRGQRMLEEVLEVQRCAEEELAALAATRRTTEQLGRLMELVTQMGSVLDQHGAYTELDVAFHDVIGEAANNRLLRTMLDPVREVIRDGYVLTEELPGAPERSWKGHQKILRAIEKQDAKAARTAMHEHLEMFRKHLGISLDAGR